MTGRAACCALAVILAFAARAQDPAPRSESVPTSRATSLPTSATLEAELERIRRKYRVPALGGAVTSGERLLAIAATGHRARGVPDSLVTVHDRWHLGSCTKSMTATMLARLVERGTIRFDTTIGEVFEDWPSIEAQWKPVTIEQMLAHRSGMPADLSPGGLSARLWLKKGTPSEQRIELARAVLANPPLSRPGFEFLYTNAGFAVAGLMAERRTGKAWEALMQQELFLPLEMNDVGFGAPGDAAVVDQPWGHRDADGSLVAPGPDADNPPAIAPAGAVHATLADWAKYAAAHLRGARGSDQLLSPQTFTMLHARPKDGEYAFGWGHHDRPWAKGHVLSHSGSNRMWFCAIWLAPKIDAAFLAVCNQGGDEAARATDEAIGVLIESFERERDPSSREAR